MTYYIILSILILIYSFKLNVVLHEYRGFKKGSYFITIGVVSIFNRSVFKMFENASRKLDIALGYKKHPHGFRTKK